MKTFEQLLGEARKKEQEKRAEETGASSAKLQASGNTRADAFLKSLGIDRSKYKYAQTPNDVKSFRSSVDDLTENTFGILLPSQFQELRKQFPNQYQQLEKEGSDLTSYARSQLNNQPMEMDVFRANYKLNNAGEDYSELEKQFAPYTDDMSYIKDNTDDYEAYKGYLQAAMGIDDEQLQKDVLKYGMEKSDAQQSGYADDKAAKETRIDEIEYILRRGYVDDPAKPMTDEEWDSLAAEQERLEEEIKKAETDYFERYQDDRQQTFDEEWETGYEKRLQAMQLQQQAIESKDPAVAQQLRDQADALNAEADAIMREVLNKEDAAQAQYDMIKPETPGLKEFGQYVGSSVMKGFSDFANAAYQTYDVVLGKPIDAVVNGAKWAIEKVFGTDTGDAFRNPLSKWADKYKGVNQKFSKAASEATQEMGGGIGWEIGSDVIGGLVQNVPNAVMAVLTGGANAATAGIQKGAQTLMQTAGAGIGLQNTMPAIEQAYRASELAVNAVSKMITNPQYWLSFAQSLGNDYNEALEKSGSPVKAAWYSTIASLLNAGIEIGASGTSGIQGINQPGDESGFIRKVLEAVTEKDLGAFGNIIDSASDEAMEELEQSIVSGMAAKVIFDAEKPIVSLTNENAIIGPGTAREMLVGGLTGGLMAGGAEASNAAVGAYQDKQAQREYAKAIERYFGDSEAVASETETDATMPAGEETAARREKPLLNKEQPVQLTGEVAADATNQEAGETPARREKPPLGSERPVQLTGEETAYQYGLSGRSQEELLETLKESEIEQTEETLIAYTKGETQRKKNEIARVDFIKNLNKGGKNGSRKGTFRSISAQELELYKDRGIKGFSGVFSDKQRAVSNALRKFAETVHMNIVYFESPTDENGKRVGVNGFYDQKTNTVYLDVFAGKGNEQAMMRAAAHEFTHVIQDWSPEKYTKLQDALIKYYYSTGNNTLRELVQGQMDKAKKAGIELSESEAMDEVTADACEMMFSDIDAMREIARTDKTLFEKIGEWINKFVDSIKQAMEGIRSSTEESRLLMESKEAWENARKIWYQALEDVARDNPGSVTETAKTVDQTAEIAGNVQNPVVKKADSVVRIANKPVQIADGAAEVIKGAAVKNSLRTWTEDERTAVTENLKKQGFKEKDVKEWIHDVDGIAAQVAKDKDRLDFTAADNQVMLKNNQEYVKTLDASTLCAKRLVYQGTFNAVQHALPDRVMTSDDLIDLRNLMAKKGYETPCGICYVESRRRHLGKFADEWVQSYQGEYKPHLDDVTTTDGLERLRKEHPEAYNSFMAAMKKKGSNNPKVVELRTEYRGDIRKLTNAQIKKIREIGGLRVQSFSDFETPHLLDMMQAVLDMAAKGLTSQAYTKVPNFAAVFGDTGIKINLSLIAEGSGLDEDGNLMFSSYEGMDFDRAMELREQYSENVGTILVGLNDAHIKAAMADDRIDFIIPFHKSGWGQEQMARLSAIRDYEDYTDTQNERRITGYRKNGNPIYKNVERNFYPELDYWDFSVSGTENAEKYLQMCAEDGRIPKFNQFLVDNGDGSYSLPEDGSADGYWKMLIDYKMYDNDGVGAPQRAVQPVFNMEEADRVLREYEGGADTLPVAKDVVTEFVDQLKKNDAGVKHSLRSFEKVNEKKKSSQRDTEYKTDRELLASALEGVTKNAEETQMLREYQEIAAKLDADERRVQEINERIRELRLEDVNTPEEQMLLEERKGLEKGITTADRRLFQMERLQPLQRIAKIQRREAEEALQKARRHLERYKEGVVQREYIGRIKRTSDKLAKWLTKPNNQRYVPEDLRRPLAEFLLAIDRGSETMLTSGGMTQADRDYARIIADLRDVVSNISAYQNDQSESGKVYSMYIDLPRGFVEMMTEHARKMDAKTKEMGGRMTLNRMDTQELEELFMTLTAIASSITHTNDFLSTENAKRVGEVAQESIGYLRDQKPVKTESKIGEFLNWDNLQPVYAFERYGEGGKQIFRMLQDGQSKLAFNTQEIVKEAEKLYTAKEAKQWSEEIKTFTIGGKEVRIPVANIMSLYCLMRRQQGIGHLYGEGIRVGDFKDGAKTVRDEGHNIGDADIARMVGSLTERQKDVAEKLQQVMSTKGSRWGNEISMKRFGYRMFTEKNYFPIEVDRTHLPARTDNGRGNELYRLLNISSTKPITRGANNRIMLNNIFDVFSSHMSDMAQYNAMALPVLDAVKWLNYKESEMEEVPIGEEKEYRQKYTESVRDAARDAYGYAANKYIIGVLRDINGAQMTGGEGYGKMMLGRVNRASVAANLRVAFLQPLSIIRAGMVLNGSDILKGVGVGATRIKQNLQEMEKHSGIAAWKGLGFYDVNIGRSVSKLIKHDETSMDKLIDASMKGAEIADKLTWALMWEGAKRDVARTTSPSSEGFLDKVAERFEEVIYKTQVVDSVLTRSQYMRNPGFFAKWTSSFMSEPTTTYNMLLNAYSKFTTEARNTNFQKAWQKTGKMVFRTMGVYTVTAAVNAVVESLMGAWRDEDDYKTFMQKFTEGYFDNFINNMMPFNKLPLISDVYEYAKKTLALFGVDTYGYGDTNVITQWLDQLYAGLEIIADKVNGEPTNYTEYGAIYKLMQGVSSLAGVPAASFMREAVAMWNNTGGHMTGRKIVVYKTSKSQGYQQMYNAIMADNAERVTQIQTELKENGAEDKQIISGLRSLAKQDYIAGNLTGEEASAFLMKHCDMDEDEAYWKLEEWAWEAQEEAENFSVYGALEEALLTGEEISTAVHKLTDHGYTKEKVQSKVREIVREGYLAGDLTQAKAAAYLKTYGGLNDNEVYFKQQQYEYERLTGDSTSSDACMIFYAIDNKRSPESAINAALKHGKTKSGLASSLTSRYKQQYIELLKTNKSAAYQLATRLAGIFDYLGYDGTKKVQGWTETK